MTRYEEELSTLDETDRPRPINILQLTELSFSVSVGDCFSTKAHAHISLCQFSELKKKRHTFKRLNASKISTCDSFSGGSDKSFLAARCINDTCSFRFKVMKRPNAIWEATIVVPHSCPYEESTSPSAYLPCMLSDIVVPLITSDISAVNFRSLQMALQPYVRRILPNYFLQRVKSAALNHLAKMDVQTLKILEGYVSALNLHGHSAKVFKKNGEESVSIALSCARDAFLRRQSNVVKTKEIFDTESVRLELEQLTNPDSSHLYGVVFVSSVAKKMVSKLVPVFQADAAHCTSVMRGSLLSLFGSDSNHRMVLLAIMLVCDNEKESVWSLFFDFVRENLQNVTWCNITVITDQDKGLIGAQNLMMPDVKRFFCSKHRSANVGKYGCVKSAEIFMKCVNAARIDKCENLISQLSQNSAGFRYINRIPHHLQFPVFHGELYGRQTDQGVESMNNAFKRVRAHLIPTAFIMAINQDFERHCKASKDALSCKNNSTPRRIGKKLQYLELLAEKCSANVEVVNVDRKEGLVSSADGSIQYKVSLLDRCCDCGHWQLDKFPCHHATRLCNKLGLFVEEFLHIFDRSETWKSQYTSIGTYTLPSTSSVQYSTSFLQSPLSVPLPRGRPKRSRAVSSLEQRHKKCGRCQKRGHNVRTCSSVFPPTQSQ